MKTQKKKKKKKKLGKAVFGHTNDDYLYTVVLNGEDVSIRSAMAFTLFGLGFVKLIVADEHGIMVFKKTRYGTALRHETKIGRVSLTRRAAYR